MHRTEGVIVIKLLKKRNVWKQQKLKKFWFRITNLTHDGWMDGWQHYKISTISLIFHFGFPLYKLNCNAEFYIYIFVSWLLRMQFGLDDLYVLCTLLQ